MFGSENIKYILTIFVACGIAEHNAKERLAVQSQESQHQRRAEL